MLHELNTLVFTLFVQFLTFYVFCFSGYVIGILMMAIIILLGAGITVGYFYKRSVSKSQQDDQSFGSVIEGFYERLYSIYFFFLFEEVFNF